MGAESSIEWTDHSFNPWWGCEKVSAGCTNCYAEKFAKRLGFGVWGNVAERRFFGEAHWNEPLKWNRAAEKARRPARVFCASMADVLEDRRDLDSQREQLFHLVEETPWLRWLMLTKRPQNYLELVPVRWRERVPPNVWWGTSIEDEATLVRVDPLLLIPAAGHFLSLEPLLGYLPGLRRKLWPENVKAVLCGRGGKTPGTAAQRAGRNIVRTMAKEHGAGFVDWAIVGYESGAKARAPMLTEIGTDGTVDLEPIHRIVSDCRALDVPVFVKQLGAKWAMEETERHTQHGVEAFPRGFKGDDMEEWPEALRVREVPAALFGDKAT